jgi:hypothetical protein
MVQRWPGGSGTGALLAAGAVLAAVLAVRAGRWRPVLFVVAVVVADSAVLLAQYVITAYGPPSDPLAGPLLESQLDVTVFRVALVPAALIAVAGPLFAGLALRRPPPADRPADPPAAGPSAATGHRRGRQARRLARLDPVPADEHEVRQEAVPPRRAGVGHLGPGVRIGVAQ